MFAITGAALTLMCIAHAVSQHAATAHIIQYTRVKCVAVRKLRLPLLLWQTVFCSCHCTSLPQFLHGLTQHCSIANVDAACHMTDRSSVVTPGLCACRPGSREASEAAMQQQGQLLLCPDQHNHHPHDQPVCRGVHTQPECCVQGAGPRSNSIHLHSHGCGQRQGQHEAQCLLCLWENSLQ